MHVILVCENFSLKMGGESQKSYFFMQRLIDRGIDVSVVTHARVRDEVKAIFKERPDVADKFLYVEDTALQHVLWRLGELLPNRLRDGFSNQLINILTMYRARRHIADLAARGAQIVWQPTPISPKSLCLLTGAGLPVVCGPLCGGLNFPSGFKFMDSVWTRAGMAFGRQSANLLHVLFPGKRHAAALIVSNERTKNALPRNCRGRIYVGIPESGVDLDRWPAITRPEPRAPVRFLFVGRLVDWKGVQYLVRAFGNLSNDIAAELHLVGSGPMRSHIESLVQESPRNLDIRLHRWKSSAETQEIMKVCDVFVMPSLRECGGNAILEAMASAKPLIVCNWAGPAQYTSPECAIQVDPVSPEQYILDLADAMTTLAIDPLRRTKMGLCSRRRVETNYFDWDAKTSRILDILNETLTESA